MTKTTQHRSYRPTESKFKGGAKEMYVAYDLEQRTRSGGSAVIPKVKRVYIAGDVQGWNVGDFRKRSGREVHGVLIEYEQSRKRYRRQGYTAARGGTEYKVAPTGVEATSERFSQVVEVPPAARNVQFYKRADDMPERYRHAKQAVR